MKKLVRPGPRTEQKNELVNRQLLTLLTDTQYSFLDSLSRETKKSKSVLIRKAIDSYYFSSDKKDNSDEKNESE